MNEARKLASVVGLSVGLATGCVAQQVDVAAPPSAPEVRAQKPEGKSPIKRTTFESVADPSTPDDAKVSIRIRAHVNGEPIMDDEVREMCYLQLMRTMNAPEPERSRMQKEIFTQCLQTIIDREVLMSDAMERIGKTKPQYLAKLREAASKECDKKIRNMKESIRKQTNKDVVTDEDLKQMMEQQGMTLEGFRRREERDFMAMEYARSRIFGYIDHLGHQQIVEYYKEHANEFQCLENVKWHHIFVDFTKYPTSEQARAMAQMVASRLRKGDDIKDLLTYDNGDASSRQGEGYGKHRGEIQPSELEQHLFQMKNGEVGPLLEAPAGIHVFRLVKRENAGTRPLDEKLQNEIKKKLQGQVADREYKRIIAELRRRATIEIAKD